MISSFILSRCNLAFNALKTMYIYFECLLQCKFVLYILKYSEVRSLTKWIKCNIIRCKLNMIINQVNNVACLLLYTSSVSCLWKRADGGLVTVHHKLFTQHCQFNFSSFYFHLPSFQWNCHRLLILNQICLKIKHNENGNW